jgi:hypothetical protein
MGVGLVLMLFSLVTSANQASRSGSSASSVPAPKPTVVAALLEAPKYVPPKWLTDADKLEREANKVHVSTRITATEPRESQPHQTAYGDQSSSSQPSQNDLPRSLDKSVVRKLNAQTQLQINARIAYDKARREQVWSAGHPLAQATAPNSPTLQEKPPSAARPELKSEDETIVAEAESLDATIKKGLRQTDFFERLEDLKSKAEPYFHDGRAMPAVARKLQEAIELYDKAATTLKQTLYSRGDNSFIMQLPAHQSGYEAWMTLSRIDPAYKYLDPRQGYSNFIHDHEGDGFPTIAILVSNYFREADENLSTARSNIPKK